MSKLTPQLLEEMLDKITDKFTDAIKEIMSTFNTILTNTVQTQFELINARLSVIETKLANSGTSGENKNIVIGNSQNDGGLSMAIGTALLEVERQREETKLRSCNAVFSGLELKADADDKNTVENFCEENLTVKPIVKRTRRFGKAPNIKLCVTLDHPECVEDLIQSSQLLRKSTNPNLSKVYINRDLTKAQLEIAYKARCQRRNKSNGQGGATHSGGSNQDMTHGGGSNQRWTHGGGSNQGASHSDLSSQQATASIPLSVINTQPAYSNPTSRVAQ